MTSPGPVYEKSDKLLSGGFLAVRGAAVPHDDGVRAAVAVTVRVPAGHFQVMEADGSCTATILLGPGEALGIGVWMREAAQAADKVGPPLYDWE